jgi:hypothetical protein
MLERNEPCRCGSGKKYKRCHLDEDRAAARAFEEMTPTLRQIQARVDAVTEKLRREYDVYINYVIPVKWRGSKGWAIGSRVYSNWPQMRPSTSF